MHQTDFSIIEKSNISTDAVIVNQCNCDSYDEVKKNNQQIKMVSVKERGLSKSRNKAIELADHQYCLLCDDDEVFENNYAEIILQGFDKNPEYDVLIFIVDCKNKKYKLKEKEIGYLSSLKVSSWQIAFKREKIIKYKIQFDENYGSGTERCFGEENIFLFDCLKNNLKIKFIPKKIGCVKQEKSEWFDGYNENYFLQKGYVTRRLLGSFFGFAYCHYFVFKKNNIYKKETNFLNAYKNIMKGYKEFGKLDE